MSTDGTLPADMQPHPPGISVVIPTWNGRRLLEEFLPTVIAASARHQHLTRDPIEVLVVDDGGTDDTAAWLAAQVTSSSIPIRCLRLDVNRGFGGACLAGATAAVHSRLLLLNNDVAVEPDSIAPLVAQFDGPAPDGPMFAVHCRTKDLDTGEDVGTGKVGGFSRGFLRVHRSYATTADAARPLPSIFAGGGAAMFDRSRFLELGGFDPIFAPFYFEDVALSYRAWKRGWSVAYEPASVVRHRHSSTIGRFGRRRIQIISQRNRLLMHWMLLHDRRWLAQHAAWVLGLALWSVVSFRPAFARGLAGALGRWAEMRRRRQVARSEAVRTDRDIVRLFDRLQQRPDIRRYDSPSELTQR